MIEDADNLETGRTGPAWPLYGAAFSTSLSLSVCWTAMPFILSGIGGTEVHVGYALALNSLTYMAALVLTGSLLGHMDVRRATLLATVVALVAAVAMVLAVLGSQRSEAVNKLAWVWAIIAAGGLGGAAMALFWPFLMSWVSARFEGLELNRRFGRYNGSWSGGGLIGPVLGAWLVESSPLWPVVASVVCFGMTVVLLTIARSNLSGRAGPRAPGLTLENGHDARTLADYRWMSRIALFCSWACQAIARSQFALLFVALGYTEAQFGLYYGVFALCNFLALVGAGRWAFWHFKPGPVFVSQAMMFAALLMMVFGRTLPVFFFSAVVLGIGFGFSYCSHLYYGACGSRNRSARMAIHETVISLGITIGATGGGYFAKNVGAYAPYWFVFALVGSGGLLQLSIHFVSRTLIVRRQKAATRRL
ncbi:MAG: MFS transporter [Sedimentisphaerales bacterium]|nr:MFS transporter [Sedimentisphaerales bacterium]